MKTWLGCIVVAYKTDPNKILILENKQTGNITLPSGAVEEGETLEQAAIRELKEELGWDVTSDQLKTTPLKQEFVYGSQKKDRAGDQGVNQVLLLNASDLTDPQETADTKNPQWVTLEEAQQKISFDDLKEIVITASKLFSHSN